MSYTDEQIEKWRQALHDKPSAEAARPYKSKLDVIRILLPEIISLQKNGYTLKMICEMLNSEGFEISVGSLGQYTRAAKKHSSKKRGALGSDQNSAAASSTHGADSMHEHKKQHKKEALKTGPLQVPLDMDET